MADHVIERKFLGFAQGTFPGDREPMPRAEADRDLRWAAWSREELIAAARAQVLPLRRSRPRAGDRPRRSSRTSPESEWSYVAPRWVHSAAGRPSWPRSTVPAKSRGRLSAAERDRSSRGWRRDAGGAGADRRARRRKAGRSARRMLRRLLEHEWEHTRAEVEAGRLTAR